MIFSKVALAAAAMMASSTGVVAKGTQPGSSNRCGTPHMTPEQVHNYNTLASQSMNKLNALKANAQKTGGSSIQKVEIEDLQEKEIKIYVHVLANGTKVEDGYLEESQIHEQISVLNADFSSAKLSFRLQNISYTINSTWAVGDDEEGFKSHLRKGEYTDLNLYFPITLPDSLLGYAYFPVFLSQDQAFNNPDGTGQDMFTLDGVVIRSDTLPFGTFAPFNLGRTATHEIGHWFGLDHTFGSGGCEGKGDMISDTPVEASPAYGCQVGRDSCPNQEGLDAVHNFMDYSDDDCLTEFSPLQKAYMHSAYETYRQNVYGVKK
ncbi:hypothetical protein B0H65DRAFT_229662 [Neurospora tetraspora]|uniref:Peptidase M43 pregnancy-associated plasma-A domain-containing protein n=1 Tax=Neurospora tetraspora TaxID=94610 RepID=A0AAE0JDG1_9PEZI|nr:hypothetical protein B0H65DRAFT_229662 [Neurospora tetraspora]